MNPSQAIQYADFILGSRNYRPTAELGLDNFAQYAEFVAQVVKDLGPQERSRYTKLPEFSAAWRKLYDDFDRQYQSDPMIIYRPKHKVSFEFHSSPAFVRYFRAGNRTSKTQSGYAEHYFFATGNHPYRKISKGHTFLVGLEYTKYAPNTFERKMFGNEPGNPVAPMFPIGGKWLNHYDDRKHIITLACGSCAAAGKAGSCKHDEGKSSITLFSDEGGWEQLQGAAYVLGHIDEHVDEGWYDEGKVRLAGNQAVKHTSMVITGTPLFGSMMWENVEVARLVEENPKLNKVDPKDPDSPPLASMHEISMIDAGITPREKIDAMMAGWDEMKIRARIYGKPAPTTDSPVFDPYVLAEMRKITKEPKYVTLKAAVELEDLARPDQVTLDEAPVTHPKVWTGLRVWEAPDPNGQYIAAVDSARGLTGRDASCCSILKLESVGRKLCLRLVAQYYGWLNGFEYADEVFKLAVWYQSALVVVELTGGFGDTVVLRLKQLGYWNIYREVGKRIYAEFAEDARFGIDTNQNTKPFMVASLQQFVRDRCIQIPCRDTIDEMLSFTQENTGKDGVRLVTPRFEGAGGSRDDRVMSLVIAASIAVSTPVFDFQANANVTAPAPTPEWKKELDRIQVRKDPGDYMGPGED